LKHKLFLSITAFALPVAAAPEACTPVQPSRITGTVTGGAYGTAHQVDRMHDDDQPQCHETSTPTPAAELPSGCV